MQRYKKNEYIKLPNPQLTNYINSIFPESIIPEPQKMFRMNRQQLINLKQHCILKQCQSDPIVFDQQKIQSQSDIEIQLEQDDQQVQSQKQTNIFVSTFLGKNTNKKEPQKIVQQQNSTYLYYLLEGNLQLHKMHPQQLQSMNSLRLEKQKIKNIKMSSNSEVKEGTFFTLINYKNLKFKQMFYGISKTSIKIIRIKFKGFYGYDWYKYKYQKSMLISSIFLPRGNQQTRRSNRFKQFVKVFRLQKYRRGTTIVQQDKKNTKLIIIKEGQIQYSKHCHLMMGINKQDKNMQIIKNQDPENLLNIYKEIKKINIALGEQGSIISTEFLLIKNQSFKQFLTSLKNQIQGYNIQLHNCNNFTITVNSAYVETFQISLGDLQKVLSLQWETKLINNSISSYVNLLRKTDETIKRELSKLETLINKKINDKQLIKGRLHAEKFVISPQRNSKAIKQSQLRNIEQFQQGKVVAYRSQNLSKRIDLFLSDNLLSNKNLKVKIEDLLKEKIQDARDQRQNAQTSQQMDKIQSRFAKDLQDIFMVDSCYRSQSIKRHNHILGMKEDFLKLRVDTNKNSLVIDEDCYDIKNKVFRMNLLRKGVKINQKVHTLNYLKGVNMDMYTSNIKKKCSEKINTANKIKEQFMKIKSQCQHCHCYDNIDELTTLRPEITSVKTMRIGSSWRSQNWKVNKNREQPLEKVHSKIKILSEKSKSKYNQKLHLHDKARRISRLGQRKHSAPHM